MAARVVHAVAWHGVEPSRILGLTFTNKAAGQLAESVRTALRRLLPDDALDDEPTVSTYHAYAAALLRDHALRIGREPMTQLLTEATRWQLALRVVHAAPGTVHATSRGPRRSSPATCSSSTARCPSTSPTSTPYAGSTPSWPPPWRRCRSRRRPCSTCAQAARARDELLDLVADYRARKLRGDLVDYGDQVAVAADIARRCPEVGEIERDRFALVLLDEYQDTGVAQRVLLTSLYGGGHPVTAVGDPNQAIYGWRGASVGNLLRFAEHFAPERGVHPLPLMTSFRCGGRILAVAERVAAPLRTSVAAARRPVLDVPPLAAPPGEEDAGEVLAGLLATVEDEAAWVADQVARAVRDEGTRPGEVAVLCRRRADFPLLHAALVDRDLPVEVVGLGGLLEMPEVADVVATLRVLVDPNAGADLLRLLTGPRWRIGPRDLAALAERARRLAGPPAVSGDDPLARAAHGADPVDVVSLLDALDSLGDEAAYAPEAYARLVAVRDELRRMRPLLSQPVVEAVAEVVSRIGLDVEAEAAPAPLAAARSANLAAFLDHAARFTGLDGESDLASFLAYLAAAADAEDGLDVGGVSAADTVKLLTVHKAKGLEWDVVAVPGLAHNVFPSGQGRSRYTGHGKVLPFPLRGDADDLPAHPSLDGKGLSAFSQDCTADDADEERRLGLRRVHPGAASAAGERLLVGCDAEVTEGPVAAAAGRARARRSGAGGRRRVGARTRAGCGQPAAGRPRHRRAVAAPGRAGGAGPSPRGCGRGPAGVRVAAAGRAVPG